MSIAKVQPYSNESIEPLNKPNYYARLIADINSTKKGDRILLVTMALLPELDEVVDIINSLEKASRRGVNVIFSFDSYNLIMSQTKKTPGPLFFNATWPPKTTIHEYNYLLKMSDKLAKSGVKICISNKPKHAFTNPYSNRSHIKTAIINNTVYIGGCNLSQINTSDIMVRITNPKTADWLFETMSSAVQATTIRENFNCKDKQFVIDNRTRLLIDAGVKNQSIIYDTALHIIDEAKEWIIITCQFFPNSTTAKHLLAAHKRGVKLIIYYNDPKHHAGVHHVLLQSLVCQVEKIRMPKTFFENKIPTDHQFLHAKIIASENEAIIGSHNYVPAGVKFGTAEIALHKKDSRFANEIKDFTKKLAN